MQVKELVKQFREKKGWKQVDLAERLNVSQNYVSKIELGLALPRSRKFKELLARTLDIPDSRLLESYAESKLDASESKAYQQMLQRQFLLEKKTQLLSTQERILISEFHKLSRRDRQEVLSYLRFKTLEDGREIDENGECGPVELEGPEPENQAGPDDLG